MRIGGIKLLLGRVAALGVVLTLSACAIESEEVKVRAQRVRYEPHYNENVCTIPKHQGAPEVTSRAERLVVSAFFGKRYERSMLENILMTSAFATSRYVSEVLGGRVYRVPRDNSPGAVVCPMFTDLPVAPEDLRDLWDRYAGVGLEGWRLAGLYFEDCGREGFGCNDREMVRPTIMIDEARDRWTLVHEMMHFNFSRERKRDPQMPPLSTLMSSAVASKERVKIAYASYQANRDRTVLASLQAESSWLLRNWFYHIMVHTVLEEVAVEGLLMDEYLAGRLHHVSPASLDIAIMYMERSQGKMLAEYDAPAIKIENPATDLSLRSLRSFIYQEAKGRGWREISRAVESDVAFFARWEGDLAKIISTRRDRAYEYQFFSVGREVRVQSATRLSESLPTLAREAALKAEADEHFSVHVENLPAWREFQNWKD